MTIKRWIKKTLHIFCVITTVQLIVVFASLMINAPDYQFNALFLGQFLLLSLILAISSSILYTYHEASRTEEIIKRIIHVITIILSVIFLPVLFGWSSLNSNFGYLAFNIVIIFIVYCIICFIVDFTMYKSNKKEAEDLNKIIRKMKEKKEIK